MDTAGSINASTSLDEATAGKMEEESSKVDSLEVVSSSGEILREIENAGEVLTRIELDLARSSEKLINLNSFVIHVATRENDFEAFPSDKDPAFGDSSEKALEFDLLSGILDSEVKELDDFISALQIEIVCARDTVASCQHLGEVFNKMQAKLDDCEESLKESQEQISEIKVQSANFQRIILISGEYDEGVRSFGNGYLSNLDTRIKMQTTEQQRHILRMLEKSLARELELEKKLAESRQNEELLNLRLQEEIFFVEEEAETTWERSFKAENLAEILLSSSKQLLARLQILQFYINGSTRREEDLRSRLEDHIAMLQAKDRASREHELTIIELREELKFLQEKQKDTVLQNVKDAEMGNQGLPSKIHELESVINHLQSRTLEAEKRAEAAETESKLLREANMDLQTELTHPKSYNVSASDREKLEKQLLEADIRLQHAVASAEASQEKQTMLYSMVKDMDNLIGDLKTKVVKAESERESAEGKCIILSESNADLNEELNFLRRRMECLEASLHQAEETKKATTKEISIRTKLITDLVVQLALERERLHKQIYSLKKDKRVVGIKIAKESKDSPVNKESTQKTGPLNSDVSIAASTRESENDAINFSTTSSENRDASTDVLGLEDMRDIGARQLNFKYFLVPVIVFLASAAAAFWYQHQCPQI